MRFTAVLLGLLCAGPVFSQIRQAADPQIKEGQLTWFELTETKQQTAKALGMPRMVAVFGQDFVSWQYQIGVVDHEEYSHQLVFRTSTHALISVTRNYDPERTVDELFPDGETTAHYYPNAEKPQYSLRLRRLSNGRVLMAMGTSKAGQVTGQIVLIREPELRYFYPWLFEQLNPGGQ